MLLLLPIFKQCLSSAFLLVPFMLDHLPVITNRGRQIADILDWISSCEKVVCDPVYQFLIYRLLTGLLYFETGAPERNCWG